MCSLFEETNDDYDDKNHDDADDDVEQVSSDHIPRSHEWPRHPYWAVESIRQALSLTPGSVRSQQLRTTPASLVSDAAAGGVVASGNVVTVGEMRDQATNTDATSECKSNSTIDCEVDFALSACV